MTRRDALKWLGATGVAGIGMPASTTMAGATGRESPPPRPLVGPNGKLEAVAFSPDGSRIAAGGENSIAWPHVDASSLDGSGRPPRIMVLLPQTLWLWDAATGCELGRFVGHPAPIQAVAFGPDGARIISAGAREFVPAFEQVRRNDNPQDRGEVSRHGLDLGVAPSGGIAIVWEAASGRELRRLPGHAGPIVAVGLGPRLAVAIDREDHLSAWEADSERRLHAVDDLTGENQRGGTPLQLAAFNSTATRAVAVHHITRRSEVGELVDETALRSWDLDRGHWTSCPLNREIARSIAVSHDGGRVATAGHGPVVFLRNFGAAEPDAELEATTSLNCTTLAFNPDGKRLAAGSYGGAVRVWDIASGKLLKLAWGPKGPVRALVFLPDGIPRAATGGYDYLRRSGRRRDPERGLQDFLDPLKVWDVALDA